MTAVTWDSPASHLPVSWGERSRPVTSPASPATRVQAPYGEETFEILALKDPQALIELLRGELMNQPHLLTYAAEAAGLMEFSHAIEPLLGLLEHREAVVREGAIYGLMPHLAYSLPARDALRRLAELDSSPGVQAAARDALANVA